MSRRLWLRANLTARLGLRLAFTVGARRHDARKPARTRLVAAQYRGEPMDRN